MTRPTIHPWRRHSDLLSIRSQLYRLDKSQPDKRPSAVHRVMAWKLRGNLPHAVESTALLIDAILHHSNASPHASIFSIRAVYAAAFTRFVTGFCDIGRNKERRLEPSSMLDIAKQIGMPPQFVAVRHEATHEELPSVGRLVTVCAEALEWLWDVYWSRLEEPAGEGSGEVHVAQVRAEAKQILRTFRSERLEDLRGKRRKGQSAGIAKAVEACGELVQRRKESMKAFADVLVKEKFLCPSKRTLGSSLEGAFLIWDELLEGLILEQERFAKVLIGCILEADGSQGVVEPEAEAEKEAHSQWLLHILTGDNWIGKIADTEHQLLLKEVMQWCCLHPGHWTQYIGKMLLRVADDDFREDWREIFDASQLRGRSADVDMALESVQESAPEMTEDALLERLAEYQSSSSPAEAQGWRRDPALTNTPIGIVAR